MADPLVRLDPACGGRYAPKRHLGSDGSGRARLGRGHEAERNAAVSGPPADLDATQFLIHIPTAAVLPRPRIPSHQSGEVDRVSVPLDRLCVVDGHSCVERTEGERRAVLVARKIE